MTPTASHTLQSQASYIAVPVATADRPGPWPGVIVIHDILGMSDDIREQADWLAAAGYLAVVPDLFRGKAAIRCVKGALKQLGDQRGPVFDQVESIRTALVGDGLSTGSVGVIGYCMGGGFALLMAGRPGWAAASVNYGMVPDNVADVLAGACPIVASFGGKDRSLPGAAAKVAEAAAAAGIEADVKEYPDARHGFINRFAVASPLSPILKVMGVGHDHAAAADAKHRILAFFDTYLRPPG